MTAYIKTPPRIPFMLRLGLWFAENHVGKELLPARLLAWYPKAAISSGVMEGLIAHREGQVTSRMLKLIRMQVSFTASCPFCIDMNSHEFTGEGITETEIEALQGMHTLEDVPSFSTGERIALHYTQALTETPVRLTAELLDELRGYFNETEIVVLASTIAQVNYWTRLIQGLGVSPVGFSETCAVLKLEEYKTLRKN